MRVTIEIKPVQLTAPTKNALESQIKQRFGLHYCYGTTGGGMVSGGFGRQPETCFAVSYEKRRRTKKLQEVTVVKRGKSFTAIKLVNVPAHWVAWVYVVPDFITRQQGTRTFSLETPKNVRGYKVLPKKRKKVTV